MDLLETATAARGCSLTSVWATPSGAFIGYVAGAPSFVNALWDAEMGATLAANTPLLVCTAGTAMPSPTSTPTVDAHCHEHAGTDASGSHVHLCERRRRLNRGKIEESVRTLGGLADVDSAPVDLSAQVVAGRADRIRLDVACEAHSGLLGGIVHCIYGPSDLYETGYVDIDRLAVLYHERERAPPASTPSARRDHNAGSGGGERSSPRRDGAPAGVPPSRREPKRCGTSPSLLNRFQTGSARGRSPHAFLGRPGGRSRAAAKRRYLSVPCS